MNYLGSPFTQRRSEALRTGALLDITATAVATCMGRDQMAQQHDLAHVVIKLMAVANGANSRKGDSTRITKRIAVARGTQRDARSKPSTAHAVPAAVIGDRSLELTLDRISHEPSSRWANVRNSTPRFISAAAGSTPARART